MSSISNLSLYIPHIFSNFTREDIVDVFENQQSIGKVKRVDLIAKMSSNNTAYNAAYIHFEYWNDNTATRNLQERILDTNKEAHIVYEDPWYWIVLENKTRKYEPNERKPRIALDVPAINTNTFTFTTPVKSESDKLSFDITNAPIKGKSYKQAIISNNIYSEEEGEVKPKKLDFEEAEAEEYEEYDSKLEQELDELEDLMDEEDQHQINIDSRYIQTLEYENTYLRMEIANLRAAYMALNNMYYMECNNKVSKTEEKEEKKVKVEEFDV